MGKLTSAAVPKAAEFTPSHYQEAIFDFVQNGQGSLVVSAGAGSGKTTTLLEAAKRVKPSQSVAFVAFNVSIVDTIKAQVPAHVYASTLNSMGFRAWLRSRGYGTKVEIDRNKVREIIDETGEAFLHQTTLRRLVGLAKAYGIVPVTCQGATGLLEDTYENWVELIERHDLDVVNEKEAAKVVTLARAILHKCIVTADQVMDFDDQLYLPVIWDVPFTKYDVLFVDEAQDVSSIQCAMLRRSLKPGGRLVAVGDRTQAIYSFRGAGVTSMEDIRDAFSATDLPLSISYRCAKAVVRAAQQFMPALEHHWEAPEGLVEALGKFDKDMNESFFQPDDIILCRNSAPIVELAWKLLRRGVPCKILGREIGEGLSRLIERQDTDNLKVLIDKLDTYRKREVARLVRKKQEEKAELVADKVETINILITHLPENATVKELLYRISEMFNDKSGVLTLSTIHKAKGKEYPRVFILNSFLMPSRYARQEWQLEQESNLHGVAITRARREVYYFDTWDKKPVSNGGADEYQSR